VTSDFDIPSQVADLKSAGGWVVEPAGRPEVWALNSGHYFGDGDGVSVLLRISGNDALVSDAGAMVSRLTDAQVDLTSERVKHAWATTLQDFGLHETDNRVVGRKPATQLIPLLHDLVDAMLTLDGLKVLARRPQLSRLERELYNFLDETVKLPYEPHPTVKMPHGALVRPTALVEAPTRLVYMQTASKTNVSRATLVSSVLKHANFDKNQRLIVLKGRRSEWASDYVDLLSDSALVGFMAARGELERLISTA
jgi:hypothetical protein